MDLIIDIPVIAIILMVKIILIIICTPKYIGSSLTKKTNIDNITHKNILFRILKGLLDIT